jgi:hypothetical protein
MLKKGMTAVLVLAMLFAPVMAGAQDPAFPDAVVVKGVATHVFVKTATDVAGKVHTFFIVVTKYTGGPLHKGLLGMNQLSVAYGFLGVDGAIHSFGDPVVTASEGILKKVIEGTVPVFIGGMWYYLAQVNRRPDTTNVNVNNSQQGGGATATGGDGGAGGAGGNAVAGATSFSLSKATAGANAWANATSKPKINIGGGGHGGHGGGNNGNGGTRPGHGYGDPNHNHTGPPGQN